MKLNIQVEAKARTATKRPKSVVAKMVTTTAGAKLRVNSLDANSATFGSDFLYVFKTNVKKARKGNRATEGAKGGAVNGTKVAG